MVLAIAACLAEAVKLAVVTTVCADPLPHHALLAQKLHVLPVVICGTMRSW